MARGGKFVYVCNCPRRRAKYFMQVARQKSPPAGEKPAGGLILCRQTQDKKKPRRVFRVATRKIKVDPFFPGSCTSEKTLLSLQVCEHPPYASARSRLRSLLSAKPFGFVDSLMPRANPPGAFLRTKHCALFHFRLASPAFLYSGSPVTSRRISNPSGRAGRASVSPCSRRIRA